MNDIGISKTPFYDASPYFLKYGTCEVIRLCHPIGEGIEWEALDHEGNKGRIKIDHFNVLNITHVYQADELEIYLKYLPYFPTGTFLLNQTDQYIYIYCNTYGIVEKKDLQIKKDESNEFIFKIEKYIKKNHDKLRFYVDSTTIVLANGHLTNNRVQLRNSVTGKSTSDLHGQQGDVVEVVKAADDGKRYLVRDYDDSEKYACRNDVLPYIPDWFHGYIQRRSRSNILSGNAVGAFGVWHDYKNFILSIRGTDGAESDDNTDIKITKYENSVVFNGCMYNSIVDVIEYIMSNQSSLNFLEGQLSLKHPISRPSVVLPYEVENMESSLIELYSKALEKGKETHTSIRVMIVGHFGVGKTSLARNLLGLPLSGLDSTNGIDVHLYKCLTSENGTWKPTESFEAEMDTFRRIATVAKTSLIREESTAAGVHAFKDDFPKTVYDVKDPRTKCNVEEKITNYNVDTSEKIHHYQNVKMERINQVSEKSSKTKPKLRLSGEINKHNVQKFSSAYSSAKGDDRLINIWDFGGQYVFYATHQLFHSPRAVYLLVLDLSKDLNDKVLDEDSPKAPSENVEKDVKSFCKFWMHSIYACVGTPEGQPPVILVGTHKDKLQGSDTDKIRFSNKYFDEVRELFSGTPVLNHIQQKHFLIDNVSSVEELELLRTNIVEVAKQQKVCDNEIPAKWIPLESQLRRRKADKHIPFKEVCRIDSENECPIENEDEIRLFLSFHHMQGTLIYFSDDDLSEIVVIDPQWIIDAFKCIITSNTFCKIKPNLRHLWNDLTSRAILRPALITAAWHEDRDNCFLQHETILLKFFMKLGIIAKMLKFCEDTDSLEELDTFVVPSLLQGICSSDKMHPLLKLGDSTFSLVFVFENEFVSPTLYHRTTAAALGKWPIVTYVGTYMLYENLGIYRLDEDHIGIIEVTDKTIEIRVANIVHKKSIDSRQSDRLRRFVELVFKHELERFQIQRGRQYKLGVRCNRCTINSKAIIYVDQLKEQNYTNCLECEYVHKIEAWQIIHEWFPGHATPDNPCKVTTRTMECLKGLNSGTLNRAVTETEINQVSKAIGFNWELLGMALGVSNVEIERIKMDCPHSSVLRIYHMLYKWLQLKNRQSTLEVLLQAMLENDLISVDWDLIRNMLDKLSA